MEVTAVIAAANRAASRRMAEVVDSAQAIAFDANQHGAFGGSRSVLEIQRACVDGFRAICDVAVVTVAEVVGSKIGGYAQALKNMLLVHQLAMDRVFKDTAAPGDAFAHTFYDGQVPEFHRQLDGVLQDTMDDLALGLAARVNVTKRAGGIHVDLGGGAAQVMIDSPGGRQHVGGNLSGKIAADPKELLAALSGLRQELAASRVGDDLRATAEDAILAVEREIGSGEPDPSRLKRYGVALLDVGHKLGISAGGSFLGRIAQWMAGLG
jgi:hypothetical protein